MPIIYQCNKCKRTEEGNMKNISPIKVDSGWQDYVFEAYLCKSCLKFFVKYLEGFFD